MIETTASYRGAVGGPGAVAWMPSPTDPRLRYVPGVDLMRMRDRARQLQRDNAIAAGVLQQFVKNVIGPGFTLQPTTADADYNARALALMEGWMPTADSAGLSFAEHCRLAFMASIRDGDVASVLLDSGNLQLIEGDLIAAKPGQYLNTIDGVTVGPGGRPLSFSFRVVGLDGKWTYQAIDAINVVLLARTNRPGQVRGEPIQCSSFDLYDHLDQLLEALLVAMRVAACTSLTVERQDDRGAVQAITAADRQGIERAMATQGLPAGTAPPAGGCPPGTWSPTGGPPQTLGRPTPLKMAPGMIHYIKPGEKISQLSPTQPSHNFPEVLKMMLRMVGLPMGLPLELVLLDFTGVSGPTAKASMNAANQTFAIEQKTFTDRYLKRVYRWRMSKFIKAGRIEYRPDYFNHRWITPRRPSIDLKNDLLARQMAIDVGETTLTEQLQQMGHDFGAYVAQRKGEIDALNAAGIPVLHSQSFTTGTGPPPGPPLPDQDDDAGEGQDDGERDDEDDGGGNGGGGRDD